MGMYFLKENIIKEKKWTGKGYWNYKNKGFEIKAGKGLVMEFKKYQSFPIFIGEYVNEERNGKGKEYYDYGLKFEYEYLNGKSIGKGKEYFDKKLKFEGEYVNGERNGKGIEYDRGKIEFEGEYINGHRTKGKYRKISIFDYVELEGE